jgi:hypothetical protein
MLVGFNTDPPPPPREHPWNTSVVNSSWRYQNFREDPELIGHVLEDFIPFEHYQAVQTFYDLVRWVNGDDSPFESNDCGLRPPKRDDAPPSIIPFESPICIHGRFALLFRDLKLNSQSNAVDWLTGILHVGLRDNVPLFPAALTIGKWPHWFRATNTAGIVVELKFWAWGNSEAVAMENLNSFFEALTGCLKAIAQQMKPTDQAVTA